MTDVKALGIDRRRVLQLSTGAAVAALVPAAASATTDDMNAAIRQVFGDRPINEGRVTLSLPPLAENGYSVPLSVLVESLMTPEDHVKHIAIFSPVNPIAHMASFHLGPHSGKAELSTRVRLGGTQKVRAIAEMSDGTLWMGTASTLVTLAACVLS